MKVTLTRFKYIHMFGRSVAQATVQSQTGEEIFSGTLNSCLNLCVQREFEVENAQEILVRLVVKDGYAS